MYDMSHVIYHVSCVMCRKSPVTCHMSLTQRATATATQNSLKGKKPQKPRIMPILAIGY